MSIGHLLPLPVVVLLCGAMLAPIAVWVHRRLPLVVGLVSTAGATALVAILDAHVFRSGAPRVVVHFFSGELPVGGRSLGIAFAGDPFGLALATLTTTVGCLLVLSLLSEFGELGPREIGGLACLVQLLLAAIVAAELTADTINLFVWFEVAALSSYGLTGFFLGRPIALEATFKNLVLTNSAGFAVFIGAAMLYSSRGALNFAHLHGAVMPPATTTELIALGLLVTGFATKAGLMPFHGWLPDAHTPVPGAVSALFSGLMVNLGVVALARLALQVFGPDHGGHVLGMLTAIGIASAVLGAALALVQDDLKRLLAWDTVSQMGIIVTGFATQAPHGVAGATLHLLNHGLFKALLFLCAGAIVHETGLTNLSELGGLARRRPFITAAFTVGSLAIAGVPPLNGYASLGLIHEALTGEPPVYALALVAQALTVAVLARACYLGFYRRRDEEYEQSETPAAGMRISLIALATGCVAFGVFASALVRRVAGPAASSLLHPQRYASAVLSVGGSLPRPDVTFDYGKTTDLITTAAELVAGGLVAWWVVRRGTPAPIAWLRKLHTGSVNDYAAMLAAGLVTALVVVAA